MKITKYKGILKLANQKAEKPVDVDAFFFLEMSNTDDHSSLDGHGQHHACQQELKQLKDEFERYKLRAQSVLKSKNTRVEDMEAAMKKVKENHKTDMLQTQHDFKQRSAEMEQQISQATDKSQSSRRSSSVFTDNDDEQEEDAHAIQAQATVNQLQNRQSAALMKGVGTASLLHYAEEQSRKEVELTMIKRKKLELETALRQLQEKHAASQETYQEEVEKLKEEVEKWKQYRSREGTNLEYLKNVVLGYIQTDDLSSKHSLLHVIATILHFSPKEVNISKLYNCFQEVFNLAF
ncbi:GRIP and coiled-coil domain-containing protein 1-like [Anneissia japonica]|uniref:GRIP and coiled-coil domain-containing protein 1-like n=1 Tax=Anneissia japonica TaxID=1529436 RepID=UPI001425779D|nr:GRIP and coiled-coil domain-containing protein 1-like [Anneissia japonica]